jgi:hypothetical protein
MMEIMKVIVGAERENLHWQPAEVVSTMIAICIASSHHEEDHNERNMNWSIKRSNFIYKKGSHCLRDNHLSDVNMKTSKTHSIFVLVMQLMEFVK